MVKDIQKMILSMTGRYRVHEIFMDWVKCMTLSILNSITPHDDLWRKREEEYISIMNRYPREDRDKFPEMMAMFAIELSNDPRDVLGEIFMLMNMGSNYHGQFFTPIGVSKLMASLTLDVPEDGEPISISEPTCGSGTNIIAAALVLKEKGINYQKNMNVVCQDIDWGCVYMCYVQLSLMGIDAICVQGNTLTEPYCDGYPEDRILRTPANMLRLYGKADNCNISNAA